MIPGMVDLIIAELKAGALSTAEGLVEMLSNKDIPERLEPRHPDHYQALAVRHQIPVLLKHIRRGDVSRALEVGNAVRSVLEEVENSKSKEP